MKLTKCMNGHFYDAEKFSTCPHCAGNTAGEGNDDSVTVGYSSDMDAGATAPLNPNDSFPAQPQVRIVKPPIGGMNMKNSGNGNDITRPLASVTSDWGRDVKPDDDEKTVPIWLKNDPPAVDELPTANARQNIGNTVYSSPSDFRPVVGWLVCTEGTHKGQSFNLYHGKNFIGRDSDMDVWLRNDLSVSRNRHAIIVYEPRERVFFAQPGESHELFYVNDSVVLSTLQLNDRDCISVGKTTLVFVPFCNADFTW